MRKDQFQPRHILQLLWLCILVGCLLLLHAKIGAAQQGVKEIIPEEGSSDSRVLLAASQEEAGSTTDDESEKAVQAQEPWAPPTPPPDEFDWIQLISGEWLKGELMVLYDRELEFDSDEMGLQKFDWEDVKQVRGHQLFSVRFEGPITVEGYLRVTEDKVFVTVGDEVKEFDRNQLIAIAIGEPKEISYWTAKISLGLNISSGNTDQVQYNSKMDIRRRTSKSRFVIDYLGNFTTTDDVDTVDNQRLRGFYDIFKTRRYYLRPIFGEYYRDPFQNVENRSTIGVGMGYHIIDTSKTTWDASLGVAYQYTKFSSVEPGKDSSTTTPALVVGTLYERELTNMLDLILNYSFNIVNEDSGQYTHHAIATLETELTDLLDFDISLVWDRTQKPQPRDDGSVPDKDDFQTIFALGIDF
jgi:putative salt-induced outer membrane protein YdiY